MESKSVPPPRKSALKFLALAFVLGLLAGLALAAAGRRSATLITAARTPRSQEELLEIFAPAIKHVLPAVTSLSVTRIKEEPSKGSSAVSWQPPAAPPDQTGNGKPPKPPGVRETIRGSGILVGPEGPLLTSCRLVQGAAEITVSLSDKRQFRAHVVGTDPITDLAVLIVDGNDLPYAKFGDSSQIGVGDFTVAIGSPFVGGDSVALGIISATGRGGRKGEENPGFFQTLHTTSPGDRGSALINQWGELVGITTSPLSVTDGDQSPGLAVPANVAREVMVQILMHGRVVRHGLAGSEKVS